MIESSTDKLHDLIDSFPALPATVTSVLSVTADPESTATDLMQAILPDQTMCGAILKIANSAFLGIPREVSTIDRAVVVLGFTEIQNIVISKAVFGSFPKLNKEAKEDVGRFWNHAFACGLAAKIIAEHHHLSGSEFFVAGLLHDIGKLSMLMAFPEEYQIRKCTDFPSAAEYLAKETSEFGMDHCRAGAKITSRWMLPNQLVTAAAAHHTPGSEDDGNRHSLVVHFADLLAHSLEDLINPSREALSGALALVRELSLPWQNQGLELTPALVTGWHEQLLVQRQNDQVILDILSGG